MPDRRRVGRSTLPDQRTLLSWLFVGRLVLAVGILLGAGLVWTERPQESFLVTIAVVVALLFTGYGAWRGVRPRPAGGQRLPHGAGAGGPRASSPRSSTSRAAAVGVPRALRAGRGRLRAPHAAHLGRAHRGLRLGAVPGRRVLTRAGAPDTAFWAQVVVFNVVFAIVAVLGHRLREAGMEQADARHRAQAGPARGRRHPAEHPVGRADGGRGGPARLHQPDGPEAARPRRRRR